MKKQQTPIISKNKNKINLNQFQAFIFCLIKSFLTYLEAHLLQNNLPESRPLWDGIDGWSFNENTTRSNTIQSKVDSPEVH